ncbi:MAG: DUF4261 domain-containing protein [Eubacteriales bacterium]
MNQPNTTEKQSFVASVLLDEAQWSKAQFINDLHALWGIEIEEKDVTAKEPNTFVEQIEKSILIVSFMNVPVPNGEAEQNAAMNWMWKDGVSVVQNHKAHILVVVQGESEPSEKAMILTMAVSTLLKQNSTTSVLVDGIVHADKYYEVYTDMMKAGEFPTPLHVWIGLTNQNDKAGMYTFGLRKFGKEEMEIYYDSNETDPQEVQEFINNLANYVVTSNVTFKDGETVGVSETHFCKISLSEGIAVDGNSLKIDYTQE